MRILVHDYSGHPFQVELSRELARRGHEVTHSFCPGWVSGKGKLVAEPGETIVFDPVGPTEPIDKSRFVRRVLVEARLGLQLLAQVRRTRAQQAMLSNAQIPTLVVFALGMLLLRKPWVLWHQDVYAVAVRSFAGDKLGRGFRLVAHALENIQQLHVEEWIDSVRLLEASLRLSDALVHVSLSLAHLSSALAGVCPAATDFERRGSIGQEDRAGAASEPDVEARVLRRDERVVRADVD